MAKKKKEDRSIEKEKITGIQKLFVQGLLEWNQNENMRQMPWKGEKDPFKIWLSEIILQQTRVGQGLNYYQNFISAFPNIHALANASEEKVFKLWEGLGYYSRCKNLLITAKFISSNLNGIFPKHYESILQLKGVGSYTASAIASFAYNLPHAVLDGNVFRVLSRIFDIETPIDSTRGKKEFSALAQNILPKQKSAEYNQAIMDFGAVICKPSPECKICFFNKQCKAFLIGKQDLLPIKEKEIKIRERWFNYFVLHYKDQFAIRQRISKDIWQQLFEFILIETDKSYSSKELLLLFKKQYGTDQYNMASCIKSKQKLTHQAINFCFQQIELDKKENIPGFFWVKIADMGNYAFPKTLQQFVVNRLK